MKTNSLPQTKHAKLVYLLDHWDDIYDPNVTSTQGGEGGGVALLPLMSRHPSVVELARCLTLLKAEAPTQHDHLKAYHCAEWRVHRWQTKRKRSKGGKVETIDHNERRRIVPGWVRFPEVWAGEARLEALFRGPVFIPGELWDALTLSSAEIESKRQGRRRGRESVAA